MASRSQSFTRLVRTLRFNGSGLVMSTPMVFVAGEGTKDLHLIFICSEAYLNIPSEPLIWEPCEPSSTLRSATPTLST